MLNGWCDPLRRVARRKDRRRRQRGSGWGEAKTCSPHAACHSTKKERQGEQSHEGLGALQGDGSELNACYLGASWTVA